MKNLKIMYVLFFIALLAGCAKNNDTPAPAETVAFTMSPENGGQAPLVVTFTNTSTATFTEFNWDFGNGQTSKDKSPTPVTYTVAKEYTITLTATTADTKTKKDFKKILKVTPQPVAAPVANFTFTPTTGTAPLQVAFTNTSTNVTSYTWEFGNGQTATLQNPTTTYTTAGTYTIKSTATGADGKTNAKTATITVTAPTIQTYTLNDKWISAGGRSPKSYRNHHYLFELKEETAIDIMLTSSADVDMYLFNELDFQVAFTNTSRTSATIKNTFKAGKYRLIAIGREDSEANYVLAFAGKFAAKPEKVTSQYQQIVGKWSYTNSDEAMSARNRHYDIEITQNSQLDFILTSTFATKLFLIDELGFTTTFSDYYSTTVWGAANVKKGKYRLVVSSQKDSNNANFVLSIFGQFANVTEIKSIEQQVTGAWANSSTLATSPNNPKYTIEMTQDSVLDVILLAADANVYSLLYILNDKGDIVSTYSAYYASGIAGTMKLKKGIYTIVAATQYNNKASNFTLTVFGHYIANFKAK